MTQVAIIGRYYKTFEAAEDAFLKMDPILQDTHVVVEFKEGFMIIGKLQLAQLEGNA